MARYHCFDCAMQRFCKRWFVVTDKELANPFFIIDVRAQIHRLGCPPSEVTDLLQDRLSELDGLFRNAAWLHEELNWSLFQPTDEEIDEGRYQQARERILDWIAYNFGKEPDQNLIVRLHGVGRERFRVIASAARAIYWPRSRFWGLRGDNDNVPGASYPDETPR